MRDSVRAGHYSCNTVLKNSGSCLEHARAVHRNRLGARCPCLGRPTSLQCASDASAVSALFVRFDAHRKATNATFSWLLLIFFFLAEAPSPQHTGGMHGHGHDHMHGHGHDHHGHDHGHGGMHGV